MGQHHHHHKFTFQRSLVNFLFAENESPHGSNNFFCLKKLQVLQGTDSLKVTFCTRMDFLQHITIRLRCFTKLHISVINIFPRRLVLGLSVGRCPRFNVCKNVNSTPNVRRMYIFGHTRNLRVSHIRTHGHAHTYKPAYRLANTHTSTQAHTYSHSHLWTH